MKMQDTRGYIEERVNELATKYLADALSFYDKRSERNFVAANVFARRLAKTARILRNETGDVGRAVLENLMDHENQTVSSIAATDCLEFSTIRAEEVLSKNAATRCLDGLAAETALKEWRVGRKLFP